jgi:hypothetical protein
MAPPRALTQAQLSVLDAAWANAAPERKANTTFARLKCVNELMALEERDVVDADARLSRVQLS